MLNRTSSSSSSSSVTCSSQSSMKSPNFAGSFRRFFSKHQDSDSSESTKLIEKERAPYDAFSEIMALNARHGHPSVQAHLVKSSKKSSSKSKLTSTPSSSSLPSGPPPPYDAFEAIMRINARSGHPSVQTYIMVSHTGQHNDASSQAWTRSRSSKLSNWDQARYTNLASILR
ncbi:hypothetical protein JCM5353_003615 [Sporobolomyces roseus]